MTNRIIDDIVRRYVAIISDGTSSQNFINIEAKEIAAMPMDTKSVVLNKLIYHVCHFLLDNYRFLVHMKCNIFIIKYININIINLY